MPVWAAHDRALRLLALSQSPRAQIENRSRAFVGQDRAGHKQDGWYDPACLFAQDSGPKADGMRTSEFESPYEQHPNRFGNYEWGMKWQKKEHGAQQPRKGSQSWLTWLHPAFLFILLHHNPTSINTLDAEAIDCIFCFCFEFTLKCWVWSLGGMGGEWS